MAGQQQDKTQIGEDQFHGPELDAARQEIWDNGIKQVSAPADSGLGGGGAAAVLSWR